MPKGPSSKKTKQLLSKIRTAQWDPTTPQGQRMRSKHKDAWDPATPKGRERRKKHSEHFSGKPKVGYHLKTDSPSDDIAMRECLGLGCGRMFKSWGNGNRICDRCKSTEGWSNHNFSLHQGG